MQVEAGSLPAPQSGGLIFGYWDLEFLNFISCNKFLFFLSYICQSSQTVFLVKNICGVNMRKFLLIPLIIFLSIRYNLIAQTANEYFNNGITDYNYGHGDFQAAIENFTKAIELNPNFYEAFCERGIAKDYLKDYSGAIEDFSKAIELNPAYTFAYANRGLSKYHSNDIDGACLDWDKAIELGSTWAPVLKTFYCK
jgi:tetratricopeptide (TPR) repeat protein